MSLYEDDMLFWIYDDDIGYGWVWFLSKEEKIFWIEFIFKYLYFL